MNRPVPVQAEPLLPSIALVMNVADRRGVELVRALAATGVGVAVHFLAQREAILSLVEHIWDRGGRVCAFDGREAGLADREALLGEVRSALGDVQMVLDASRRSASREACPETGDLHRKRSKADPILRGETRTGRGEGASNRRAWS